MEITSKRIQCNERLIKDNWTAEISKYMCVDDCVHNRIYWVDPDGNEYDYDPSIREEIEDHTLIGNIFNCQENIICHQVNMQKKMGSGIAKQIRERYPNVYDEYIRHEGVLGEVLFVPILEQRIQKFSDGGQTTYNYPSGNLIANMYSQNDYGYDGKIYTDYNAMRKCFSHLYIYISQRAKTSLAIPYKIGCGLGGGDWNIVSQIIIEELKDIDYTIYKLEY